MAPARASSHVTRPAFVTPTKSAGASARIPAAIHEGGFTIVEVMVAMVIMLISVLGTLIMLQGSVRSQRQTTARVQATNLARDLIERSRQATYASVSSTAAPATLRATLPASDAASALAGSSFTVKRGVTTYTVTVIACSIDDPSDGVGVGDATFCAEPNCPPDCSTGPQSGSDTPVLAASVNVLGVAVSAGSSAVDTVCKALGNAALLSRVSKVASRAAPVSVCPSGAGPASGSVPLDTRPDDLRRVNVAVSWDAGRSERLSQTTLLINTIT